MLTLGQAPMEKRAEPLRRPPAPRSPRTSAGGLLWFVAPAAAFYLAIVLIPAGQGIFFAFTDWDGLTSQWSFVGVDNLVRLFEDPLTVRTITNTLTYAGVTTVFENIIGLLLALGLNSRIRSRHLLRVMFFLPVVILSIVVAYLWKFLLTPEGIATDVVRGLGFADFSGNWLSDPNLVVWSICVIVVWQFSGFTMVIYLAGLQGVPQEQLESAALDGAGPVRRFWYVVRPLLAPAIAVNVLLSLIRGLMIFDQVWATTLGGPANSSHSLSTLVYRTAFQFGQLGQAAAIALALAILVAVLGFLQYRLQQRGRSAR